MPDVVASSALRSSWRKVSSTENLQAFAEDCRAYSTAQGTAQTRVTGLCMLLLAAVLALAELSVLVAKLVGRGTWWPLQVVQADNYYMYLVPMMVPMVVLAVTLNWFSLKLFKHNS